MRTAIVNRYSQQPYSLAGLNTFLDNNALFEGGYNVIRSGVFEEWIQRNVPGVVDNRPTFRISGRLIIGDRLQGTQIIEAKAIAEPRGPNTEEVRQMGDYAAIIRGGLIGVLVDRNRKYVGQTPTIDGVTYVFNRGSVAQRWNTALVTFLAGRHRILIGQNPFDPNRTYND